MLFIRFLDPDTAVVLFDLPVVGATLEVGLNQSTRWSATIPADVPGIEQIYQGMTVEWYIDGEFIFEGILQEFSPNIPGAATLAINGRSFLDSLYAYKSYKLSYYNDEPLLGILSELLLHAGWALGDIGTLEDVDQVTTIDLRSERNLLTQINAALSNVAFAYWREGETRLGTRTVDIGLFQQKSGLFALMPYASSEYLDSDEDTHTITSLSYQINFADALYAVSVEGGNVIPSAGVERVVNLGDAIDDDTTRRIDADFPIIEDLNEKVWTVVNLRDFPYPGGIVQSSDATLVNTVSVAPIGDSSGGAVETDFHQAWTFVPYPGRLNHVSVRLGARDAQFTTEFNAGNFLVYFRIYEIDPANNNTVTAIVHHETFGPSTLPAADMAWRIEPNAEVILEAGKLYAVGFGLTVAPTADVVRCAFVVGNRTATSDVFSLRFVNRVAAGPPVVGTVFNNANVFVPAMEIVTERIGTIFAGSTTEKQPKFAPPKTGAVSAAGEIQKAGEALYFYGINRLLENPAQKREFNMSVMGSKHLPKPGDTIYVKGESRVEFYDSLRGKVIYRTTEEIDDDLRISSYTANFQGDDITINYKLLDDRGVAITERLLALYKETKETKPPEGAIWVSPWGLLLDTINVTIASVSPNAFFDDGTAAREVTVDIHDGSVASLPTNTDYVYLAGNPYGTSAQGTLRIEVTQEPTFVTASEIKFLVGFQNRGWEFGDSADLTVKLVWR